METRSAILTDIHRPWALLADSIERTARTNDATAVLIAADLAAIEAKLDRIVADLADDDLGA